MLNADQYAPDPVYQRHIAQHIAALDDAQVDALLAQLADRWRRPDDVVPEAPRDELTTKFTLDGLLYGPAAAQADFDRLRDSIMLRRSKETFA